jgi:cytochrome P450
MYLTPDGKKRHFASFMPFYTGPRSCIASTFAQKESVLMIAVLAHLFDFSIPKDKHESGGIWLSVKASADNKSD